MNAGVVDMTNPQAQRLEHLLQILGLEDLTATLLTKQDGGPFASPEGVFVPQSFARNASDDLLALILGHEASHVQNADAARSRQLRTSQNWAQNPVQASNVDTFLPYRHKLQERRADYDGQRRYLEAGRNPAIFYSDELPNSIGDTHTDLNPYSPHFSTKTRMHDIQQNLNSPDLLAILLGRNAV